MQDHVSKTSEKNPQQTIDDLLALRAIDDKKNPQDTIYESQADILTVLLQACFLWVDLG